MKLNKINKRVLIVLVCFISVITAVNLFTSYVNAKASQKNPSSYAAATWAEAVKAKKPIVVNFYVTWCHYCKQFAPVLENLRKEYKSRYTFVLVNAEDPVNEKLVKEFMISSYPSLYLVNPKNDNRVFINQSLYSDPELLKKEFDRFLKVNKAGN